MLKRLMVASVLAASLAPVVQASAHCQSVVLYNTLSLHVGDVTVAIVESSPPTAAAFLVPPDAAPVPNANCDDGPEKTAVDGYLSITRGDIELCRNDDVDPSFDPFYFGGGLNDLEGDCGAQFSAASIPNPLLPDVEGSYVSYPESYIGTTREVITDVAGIYKVDGEEFEIPQDTTGVSARGVLANYELT